MSALRFSCGYREKGVRRTRVAGILSESVVDGPGVRFVIFCQGCGHHCPGCHNPETWDPDGGREYTPRQLIKEIRRAPALVRGVTLSGGEPFQQAAEMAELASRVHGLGMDVVTYTGYLYEELLALADKDEGIRRLLAETDLLVDGPFIQEKKDIGLRFRGSSNQRIIEVKKSAAAGEAVVLGEEEQ